MKKAIIVISLSVVLFFTFNAWAQSNNSLTFRLGQTNVQKGNDSLEMSVPLFKTDNEHFVSMVLLSEKLDEIGLGDDSDTILSFHTGLQHSRMHYVQRHRSMNKKHE